MILSIRSSHFDEFEDAMRGIDGGYLQVGRNTLDWNLGVVELGGIKLMDGRNGASVVYHGLCLPENFALFLPTAQFQRLKTNGVPMTEHSAAWLAPGREFSVPSLAGMTWYGITIDRDCMEDDADNPRLQQFFAGCADTGASTRLTGLLAAAFRVAASEDNPLRNPTATESLRAQILDATHALLQSMEGGGQQAQGRPKIGRREVIDRVVRLMEERIDQPLQVKDLCLQAGVSVATLQNMFAEHFGISPYRYLALRRLRAIHKALRMADPGETVSSICARFGVWDFGRFSSQYQSTFNIRPSQMLGRRVARAS